MSSEPYRTVFKSDYHFKNGDHKEIRKEIGYCRDLAAPANKVIMSVLRVFSRLTDLSKYQCQARFDMFGKDGNLSSMTESYRFYDNRLCFLIVQHHIGRAFVHREEAVALKGTLWDALSNSRDRAITRGMVDWDCLTRLERAAMHKCFYVSELAEAILKCSPQTKPLLFKTPNALLVVFENICDTDLTISVSLADG